MIRIREGPSTAATLGTDYPRARTIPTTRISPPTPSMLSSTQSSANIWTFLREAADRSDGPGVPRFVEWEFGAFLTCGVPRLRPKVLTQA
jgi:hypothetical protein